ncbi:hypothetical protein VCHENC02_1884A, partial [Vibrio harveyi]|jgi:osmotically-inducible protein OsmY
MKTG